VGGCPVCSPMAIIAALARHESGTKAEKPAAAEAGRAEKARSRYLPKE